MWRIRTYLSHLWRIRSNFSHLWQISANSSHVWQIRSNVKVKRICHKCEKFERICHTCEEFVRIFPRCDKYVTPEHNTALWKEKCWGDIRLFLRRLGIGRTRRWVSRLNQNLFCPSVKYKKLGNVRHPSIHFPINVSLTWSQVLNYTAKICFTKSEPGTKRSNLSTDRIFFCTCTSRHWGEHNRQGSFESVK